MLFKKKKKIQFPAASILLSVAIKEYEYELHRKRDLETRAGLFMTLLVALLTFYISNIDYVNLVTFSQLTNIEIMLVVTINIATLLTWSVSIFRFIKVLTIYKYDRLDVDDINQVSASYDEDILTYSMAEAYRDIVKKNQSKNDMKVKQYLKGVYFLIPFIISVILVYIISIII